MLNHNLRAIIFAYVGVNKGRDFASINSNNRELIGKYLYIMSLGKSDIEKMLFDITGKITKSSPSSLMLILKNQYLRPEEMKIGGNALCHAVYRNNPEMVKILLNDGRINSNISIKLQNKICNYDIPHLLSYASYHGYLKIVKLFLADPRIDPSYANNQAIEMAITQGHVEVVQLLLADPRVGIKYGYNDYRHILPLASQHGHAEIVALLLADPRINPAHGNNQAIVIASAKGHVEVVKLLLADDRVNLIGQNLYTNALWEATSYGHSMIVEILLKDKKANVFTSRQLNQAIQRSSYNGYIDIVRLLLANPKVDPADNINLALRYACEKGQLEMVKLLLTDKRVRPTAGKYANSNRIEEPIVSAFNRNHLEVVKFLYEDKRVYRTLSRELREKYRPVPPPATAPVVKIDG